MSTKRSNGKINPSTPAVSASYVYNGGSSTDYNRMTASNSVRQHYLELRELHEELLLNDENARLIRKDIMQMRKATNEN